VHLVHHSALITDGVEADLAVRGAWPWNAGTGTRSGAKLPGDIVHRPRVRVRTAADNLGGALHVDDDGAQAQTRGEGDLKLAHGHEAVIALSGELGLCRRSDQKAAGCRCHECIGSSCVFHGFLLAVACGYDALRAKENSNCAHLRAVVSDSHSGVGLWRPKSRACRHGAG